MPKKISDSGKKIGLPFWGNCAIILPMVLLANLLPYIQIVLSVILVLSIMLQRQGAELGGAWGGSGESFHTTRRGFEKFLFILAVTCGILFALSALLQIVIKAKL